MRFCRKLIPGGREKRGLAQGGDLNHRRRLGGAGMGEAMWVMGMLWSCAVHVGMAHRLLIFEGGEGAMPPRSYGGLGAIDSGGWRSAITP